MTTDTRETPLVERLRCQYEIVPGKPEHGVRSFAGRAVPTVLPTPIMLEAADALTAQAQEIERLREIAKGVDDGGHWYSQQTMDAVVRERDELREKVERQWIDADERLPETTDEVLVRHYMIDGRASYDVAAHVGGKWIFPWDRGLNPAPFDITHWMPIDRAIEGAKR